MAPWDGLHLHGQRKAGSTCISSKRLTLKIFLSAEKVAVCMLEQISLKRSLNLGHIDMDFEVLYVVDNSYCDGSIGSLRVTILCVRHSGLPCSV